MAKYKLSNAAKEDLIRIYQYGVKQFGVKQADKYFESLFDHFELIADNPEAFEAVEFIKPGYRRCVCGAESIFFKCNNNHVEIMAIIGRQDLSHLL
jgi:toxin ParE1/3/4